MSKLFGEIEALQKVKNEREVDKQELKRLQEKNAKLKVEGYGYQMSKKLMIWESLLFIILNEVAVGVGKGEK